MMDTQSMAEPAINSMECANREDIQSRFGVIVLNVKVALESNHVTAEAASSVLVEIFNGDLMSNSVPESSLNELFQFVRFHRPPLWSFIHYTPLQKLVSRCIPDHMSMIDEYIEHLNGYTAATNLIEYVRDMNHSGWNRESNELPLDNYTAVHYKVLKVSLKMDEKNLTRLSLQYVQDLWKQIAVEFDIPFLTAVIDRIMFSSLDITWLILPDMAAKITVTPNSIMFFKKSNIVYIDIDGKLVYDNRQETVFGCIADFTSKLKRGISQYCRRENLEQVSIPKKDVKNLVDQHVNFDHMEQDSVSNKQSYVISVKSDATFHHATCRSQDRSKADTAEQAREGITTIRQRLATGIPFVGFFYGFLAALVAIFCAQEEFYHTIAEIILAGVLTGVVTVAIIDHIRDLHILLFQHASLIIVAVLMMVYPPIIIVALVENCTGAIAGATAGDCGRAATVGIITGAIIAAFDMRVAKTLVKVAENYTYILLIVSVLLQGIFGIYILISIVAATAGAYVGAAIYISVIGCVIGASGNAISDMVRVVSKVIAIGAFIGASIGALTGVVSGAIIGAVVGAIISDMGNVDLLEIFGRIEPYSISVRVITIPIRAVLKILGPIANATTTVIGFITSRRTAVFRVIGAIIGGFTGAFAGVIGGACVGVIIAGFTAGLFSICYYCIKGLGVGTTLIGGAVLAIGSFFPEFRQKVVVPVIKDIGRVVDIAVLFILASTVSAVVLSIICTLAGSYFITSALIGTFGPYVSNSIGNVTAFSEAITGDFNIASSGFTGGLVGAIIAGIYRINVHNDLTEFEAYALGAVGAVTGFIVARVDKAIGDTLLRIVWIPIGGAALGAISGFIGGVLLIIAKVVMSILADIAAANIGDKVATITAVIGGFVGGIIGGYFTSSVILAGLIGIAFSTTSVAIFIAIICTIKQYHIQRGIHIPLNDIITNFGEVITDQGGASDKNWVQYKINLYKTKQE